MNIRDQRNYLIHPYYIMMGLLLMGVTALFVGFVGSYMYNRLQSGIDPIQLPNLFYFNTLLILASSWTIVKTKKSYLSDQTEKYKLYLGITLLLTTGFLISQIIAYIQLQEIELFATNSTMSAYMYLIAGAHFAHVFFGIPFLALFLITAQKKMKSPITVLLYFADPEKKRKLDLLNIYWHFLDGLWIILIAFFLINYLIG
jgi:cytochrome c oxidase subunit 3